MDKLIRAPFVVYTFYMRLKVTEEEIPEMIVQLDYLQEKRKDSPRPKAYDKMIKETRNRMLAYYNRTNKQRYALRESLTVKPVV